MAKVDATRKGISARPVTKDRPRLQVKATNFEEKKTGNLRPEKLLGVNISTEATLTSHATH